MDTEPIFLDGIGHIKAPTVRQVRQNQKRYSLYIHLLYYDLERYLKAAEITMSDDMKHQISLFDLITANAETRTLFEEALSFFLCEEITFSEKEGIWVAAQSGKPSGSIHKENYDYLRCCLLELNHVDFSEDAAPKKFRNEKAREIYEKLQKGKDQAQKQEKDAAPSLGDMVSSLCVQSNCYNLINVWDLTIYQLYDQFVRQNIKNQLDTTGLRWAAWGSEPFDFSLYYQSLGKKK